MKYLSHFKILKHVLLLAPTIICVHLGVACSDSKPTSSNPGKSSTITGKLFNKPDGFEVKPYSGQKIGPGMVYVAGGSVVIGGYGESIEPNVKREVTVTSFYLKETPVTNIEWQEYLDDLYRNAHDKYKAALPDDSVWKRDLGYNDSYVNNYRKHPSFRFYPVVGVSWNQAVAFCEWLTEQFNDALAAESSKKNKGKKNEPSTVIEPEEEEESKANKTLSEPEEELEQEEPEEEPISQTNFIAGYRLPTEAEWDYAAMAMVGTQGQDFVQSTQRVYPWGDGLSLLATEGPLEGKYLANFKRSKGNYKGVPGESSCGAPTTYVYEYPPNDLGLYDMGGNVSEFVIDLYRALSYEISEDFNPVRRDDTLDPNSDYDPINSLVNNEVRVYKGASWKDCAYWAQIGTRRYIDQNASTATIGFRYAMTSMGEQGK